MKCDDCSGRAWPGSRHCTPCIGQLSSEATSTGAGRRSSRCWLAVTPAQSSACPTPPRKTSARGASRGAFVDMAEDFGAAPVADDDATARELAGYLGIGYKGV